jgi:hypothetical protein
VTFHLNCKVSKDLSNWGQKVGKKVFFGVFYKKDEGELAQCEKIVVPLQPHFKTTYTNSGQIWLLATT